MAEDKERSLEEILLLDVSMISVEREKYVQETTQVSFYIKNLSSSTLTSLDRQRLRELEDLLKRKQLLNNRQERYFEALQEFKRRPDL